MTYRIADIADKLRVEAFLIKHNTPAPDHGVIFIAENEDGEIVAVVNGGVVPFVETMVSENPMATTILFAKLEGFFEASTTGPIIATVNNPEAGSLLNKAGYRKSGCDLYIKRR